MAETEDDANEVFPTGNTDSFGFKMVANAGQPNQALIEGPGQVLAWLNTSKLTHLDKVEQKRRQLCGTISQMAKRMNFGAESYGQVSGWFVCLPVLGCQAAHSLVNSILVGVQAVFSSVVVGLTTTAQCTKEATNATRDN